MTLASCKKNNGPFQLVSWIHNDCIVVKKNPNYWDKNHVYLDSIHVYMIADANRELELFETGELDFAGQPISAGLPFAAMDELKQKKLLQQGPYSKAYWYLCNTQRPPFHNKKFRQALSVVID